MNNRVERIFAEEQEKPEEQRLLVSFILDETGSMMSCKEATISGFNEYIGSLKRKRGTIRMTLTKFDSTKIEVVHRNVPIAEVNELNDDTYRPGAATPLYDAIARTIRAVPENRANVLCIIMTDGEENASREYTKDQVQQIIKEKEEKGWTFVYLGANQDAWSNAQQIGMSMAAASSGSSSYSASDTGVSRTFETLAARTLCYSNKRGLMGSNFFSEADKKYMMADSEDGNMPKKPFQRKNKKS